MNSAIGNFDGTGVRLAGAQTPENASNISVDLDYFKMLEAFYIKNGGTPVVTNESFATPPPVVTETPSVTINVLDYITTNEWNTFCALVSAMLANDANLFELQQRIMGLS